MYRERVKIIVAGTPWRIIVELGKEEHCLEYQLRLMQLFSIWRLYSMPGTAEQGKVPWRRKDRWQLERQHPSWQRCSAEETWSGGTGTFTLAQHLKSVTSSEKKGSEFIHCSGITGAIPLLPFQPNVQSSSYPSMWTCLDTADLLFYTQPSASMIEISSKWNHMLITFTLLLDLIMSFNFTAPVSPLFIQYIASYSLQNFVMNAECWIWMLNLTAESECWIWLLHAERWMLNAECWMLNTEHWTLNTECWALNTEHWTLNTECASKSFFHSYCFIFIAEFCTKR